MTVEEWKTIKDFTNYEISNRGRFRRRTGGSGTWAGRILYARCKTTDNYQRVVLCREGKPHTKSIASLVLEAFVGKRPIGMLIDHIDGDKDNNNVLNLEYVTPSENVKRAYRIGLSKPTRGSAHPFAKLIESQVQVIKQLYVDGLMQKVIAKQFGVDQSMISLIVNGKRRSYA